MDEEEAFIKDVEAGIAEANTGQLISNEEAVKYFNSLGTDKPLPLLTPRNI